MQWFCPDVLFCLGLEIFRMFVCVTPRGLGVAFEIVNSNGCCVSQIFRCGTQVLFSSVNYSLCVLFHGFGYLLCGLAG